MLACLANVLLTGTLDTLGKLVNVGPVVSHDQEPLGECVPSALREALARVTCVRCHSVEGEELKQGVNCDMRECAAHTIYQTQLKNRNKTRFASVSSRFQLPLGIISR